MTSRSPFRVESGEALAVGGAVAHELPSAFFHFVDRSGKMLAYQRIQCDGGLDAGCVQHVGELPQAHSDAVLSPSVIDHVRDDVSQVRRHRDAHRRIVIPDLHVGGDPDRERLVIRPGERLPLGNERILVAIRSTHGLAHDLRGREGRQRGSEQARRSGHDKSAFDKIPAAAVTSHDIVSIRRPERDCSSSLHSSIFLPSRKNCAGDHAQGRAPADELRRTEGCTSNRHLCARPRSVSPPEEAPCCFACEQQSSAAGGTRIEDFGSTAP